MRLTSIGFIAFLAPAFGGCGLFVNIMDIAKTAAADAVVHVHNCKGKVSFPYPLQSVRILATAEATVEGQRISIPLEVEKAIDTNGRFKVRWNPAAIKAGQWTMRVKVLDFGEYYIGGELQKELEAVATVKGGRVSATQLLWRAGG